MSTRPRFTPSQCDPKKLIHPPLGSIWLPLISCPAAFPIELFEIAVAQLIHHPEYNSTLILRSETVSESTTDFPGSTPQIEGWQQSRVIHRKLLPRRPGRDASLEQYCSLYAMHTNGGSLTDVLILTPLVRPGVSLPYYHPAVSHLAFRYVSSEPPTLRIEVIPLSDIPTDMNSRLYRTCLALLDTLDRYGWGALTNYKKRVIHDCLVPRDTYQDLYLIMRERHKNLVGTWQEVTDPLKHVFEDIGIATYLMLLWKDSYPPSPDGADAANGQEPWRSWPRPPGGFIDFGCGNGLLTHILIAEGYRGHGIDLRARTSWKHYPNTTKDHLHVHAFDPTTTDDPFFKPGIFIIGNHADELTPWVPVLATIYSASGYISIPCCAWSFDAKYERSSTPAFPIPSPDFADTLNLGGDGSNASSYSMYRIWLASLSLHCGWEVECETLRIPSTRNWAIIGRRAVRSMGDSEGLSNALSIVEKVIERGIFKTRKPEGKEIELGHHDGESCS